MPSLDDLVPKSSHQRELLTIAKLMASFGKGVIEKGEEMNPLLHAMTPGAPLLLALAYIFQDGCEDRNKLISDALRSVEAYAYVLGNEAWISPVSSLENFEEKRRRYGPSISTHPDRISALSISGETIGGDRLVATFPISGSAATGRKVDLLHPSYLDLAGPDETGPVIFGHMTRLLKPMLN